MQKDQVWVGTLERSDAEDMLKVMVAAHKDISPKILMGGQTVQEFEEESRQMINQYFDTQEKDNALSGRNTKNVFGAKVNGKLVCTVMAVDAVHRYRTCKRVLAEGTNSGPGFYLAISQMPFENLQLGKISYHARMSVYPEYRKGGISRLVHCFMCKYQHEQGIELMVSTTMYDVPLQGLIRYGSYVVYEIEYYVRNNLFKEYIMMTNLKTAADICDCKLKELKAKL